MVLIYRNFASFYLNLCQMISKGLYNTLNFIVYIYICITFITLLIAPLLCHSLIVFVCQKNHIQRIIFPCSFLFKTQKCILMENIWLKVVSISHIMRVKKKCLMFWLNPIILNLLMRLSCICSKFKILEKNDVVFLYCSCLVL